MQRHALRRVERFACHALDRQMAGLFPRDARLARIEAGANLACAAMSVTAAPGNMPP
jgi:hypothetical protein